MGVIHKGLLITLFIWNLHPTDTKYQIIISKLNYNYVIILD